MCLFLRVDAIVLVEGGLSRTVQEIHSGQFESESQDIAFWQKCFRELGPERRLRFWAVGSKATLTEIARQVAGGSVLNVYVAMDRDFDNLIGKIIDSPRVLYTFGYSWENDVWNGEVIEEVFYTLCGVCRDTTKVKVNEIITSATAAFNRDMRWATRADFLCFKHEIGWLPRHSPQRFISKASHGRAPSINKSAIKQCVREARSKRTGGITAGALIKFNPLADSCGHLIGTFGYWLLVYLFRGFCKGTTYPRDLIDSVAVDKLFEKIRQGSFGVLRAHYRHQLTAN